MKILSSLILALALGGATYAGEIEQPFASPPPSATTVQQSTAGEMPQPAAALSSAATPANGQATQDAVTAMLILMIQSIL